MIRTLLVDVVVWVPALALVVGPVVDGAAQLSQAGAIPADVYAHVAGIGAAAVAASGLVSRLISLPRVNAALARIGAGSVPRAAAQAQVSAAVDEFRAAVEEIPYAVRPTR